MQQPIHTSIAGLAAAQKSWNNYYRTVVYCMHPATRVLEMVFYTGGQTTAVRK